MSEKPNRNCPMCGEPKGMIHNAKAEHEIETPNKTFIVLGDGWKCSKCGEVGSFPDDIDPTEEIVIGLRLKAEKEKEANNGDEIILEGESYDYD